MKQLLILSGKGGTGKTTIATAMIKLSKAEAYADCDVDAPNLHLLMRPESQVHQRDFMGMDHAKIDSNLCNNCGFCYAYCRFDAIQQALHTRIIPYACEGCGVCELVCPQGAIQMKPGKAGDLMFYKSQAIFSTAKLKMGSGTSGKLVTEVKKQLIDKNRKVDLAIIDGSPGIGCPVIASISGVDLVLIVAEPSVSGISDMKRIVETAQKFQTKVVVCINKWDTNKELSEAIQLFCDENKLIVMGKIPFDPMVVKTVNKGLSIVDIESISGSAAKKVYHMTMHYMMNMDVDELLIPVSRG